VTQLADAPAAEPSDSIQILAAPEELDLTTADSLAAQGSAAIARRARLLLLDLTGLTFCDAHGLSAFVRVANQADKAGCRYGLIAPQPRVAKILRITALAQRLPVFTSIEDALAHRPGPQRPRSEGTSMTSRSPTPPGRPASDEETDILTGDGPPDGRADLHLLSAPGAARDPWLRIDPHAATTHPLRGQPGHGGTARLRRQPTRITNGQIEGGYTSVFELICPSCGDHPYLDYSEIPARLQQIRGPYPMQAGLTAYEKHLEPTQNA
jgi:anti-sigma B factor antagonist